MWVLKNKSSGVEEKGGKGKYRQITLSRKAKGSDSVADMAKKWRSGGTLEPLRETTGTARLLWTKCQASSW